MKRLTSVLIMLCAVITMNAQQRDYQSALGVAEQFMNGSSARQIGVSVNRASQLQLLRTGQNNAYYYFGRESGQGFVIVSGDKRMPSVLGYSFTEAPFKGEPNPNLKWWLEQYEKEYEALQQIPENKPILRTYNHSTETVSPIVTAKWDQASPFYNDCPLYDSVHTLTGCVATATAQVMYVFKYPDCGKGSVSYKTSTHEIPVNVDFTKYPFDWTNMIDKYNGRQGATDAQKVAVANLCYMAGAACKMDYCTNAEGGSAAYQDDQLLALYNNFGYDSDMGFYYAGYMTTDEWHQLLQSELLAGRPILYGGQDNEESAGHAFILDGYTPPEKEGEDPKYHINWGWSGDGNGDFALSKFTVFGYTFKDDNMAICGVQPEDNKQTVNSMFQGECSMSSTTMPTDKLIKDTVNIDFYNLAVRTFPGGTITFRITMPDGTIDEGSEKLGSCEFFNGWGETLTFTPDAGPGTYTISAYTQATGKSTKEKVYLGGDITLTVTDPATGIKEVKKGLDGSNSSNGSNGKYLKDNKITILKNSKKYNIAGQYEE